MLAALVKEVQLLHDAVIDVIKYRTLYHAQGANIDVLGRIVGTGRTGWVDTVFTILQEDNSPILEEDGETELLANIPISSSLDDSDYRSLILLKVVKNFIKHSSVPEITAAILQATQVPVQIRTTGPMQVDVVIPQGVDPKLVSYVDRKSSNQYTDESFLFPFPATLEVQVVQNDNIIQEDGFEILMEDGETPIFTEFISISQGE